MFVYDKICVDSEQKLSFFSESKTTSSGQVLQFFSSAFSLRRQITKAFPVFWLDKRFAKTLFLTYKDLNIHISFCYFSYDLNRSKLNSMLFLWSVNHYPQYMDNRRHWLRWLSVKSGRQDDTAIAGEECLSGYR
jgi:hypothetical protein